MQKIIVSDKCGIVFDMDGVVVDTSQAHYEAWDWAAKQLDVGMSRDLFEQGFGRRNSDFLAELSGGSHEASFLDELELGKEKRYRELFAKCSVLIPGIKDILIWLKEHNVPVALGTSAPKQNVDDVYAQWGLEEYFAASVCAECVSNGKPHPEVFNTAMARIDRSANSCVIFEDTSAGIKAAVASKAKTVAVLADNDVQTFQTMGIVASIKNFSDLELIYDSEILEPIVI